MTVGVNVEHKLSHNTWLLKVTWRSLGAKEGFGEDRVPLEC